MEIGKTSRTTYFLVRKAVLGYDAKDGTEVIGWEEVPNSERSIPYEMGGKSGWKQIKRTVVEEEI